MTRSAALLLLLSGCSSTLSSGVQPTSSGGTACVVDGKAYDSEQLCSDLASNQAEYQESVAAYEEREQAHKAKLLDEAAQAEADHRAKVEATALEAMKSVVEYAKACDTPATFSEHRRVTLELRDGGFRYEEAAKALEECRVRLSKHVLANELQDFQDRREAFPALIEDAYDVSNYEWLEGSVHASVSGKLADELSIRCDCTVEARERLEDAEFERVAAMAQQLGFKSVTFKTKRKLHKASFDQGAWAVSRVQAYGLDKSTNY